MTAAHRCRGQGDGGGPSPCHSRGPTARQLTDKYPKGGRGGGGVWDDVIIGKIFDSYTSM